MILQKRLMQIAKHLVSQSTLNEAYQAVINHRWPHSINPVKLWVTLCLKILYRWKREQFLSLKNSYTSQAEAFDSKKLNLRLNQVYNQLEIKICESRPVTINVLVPAFDIQTMSAGFFGVFQVALFIKRIGYHVRLVLYDNFLYDEDKFKNDLQKFTGLETLFEELEIEYVGHRAYPLTVSPNDYAVATVWYSAYLAEEIRKICHKDYFLYLIQDYEAGFYSQNSLYVLAKNTYSFKYKALFSGPVLEQYFIEKELFHGVKNKDYIHFNNACSASRDLPKEIFIKKGASKIRKLVFYSRVIVEKNMFELGALSLITAIEKGIFNTGHNWEFYGIGLGNVEIHLNKVKKLKQLPRMSLKEYEEFISTFDIGLSLMASPHPSLVPFDLAGSGILVVTNSFENKNAAYFQTISSNIITAEPNLDALVESLKIAVARVDDFEKRYAGSFLNYPKSWAETWQEDHVHFLKNCFGDEFTDQAKKESLAHMTELVPASN